VAEDLQQFTTAPPTVGVTEPHPVYTFDQAASGIFDMDEDIKMSNTRQVYEDFSMAVELQEKELSEELGSKKNKQSKTEPKYEEGDMVRVKCAISPNSHFGPEPGYALTLLKAKVNSKFGWGSYKAINNELRWFNAVIKETTGFGFNPDKNRAEPVYVVQYDDDQYYEANVLESYIRWPKK